MRVQFVERQNGPERLVCEAELVFDQGDSPLDGMKLVGISIWRSPDGETYVTFPSRAFGAGTDRKYFDFLRPVDATLVQSRRVKAWILDQYRANAQAA